MAFKIRSFLIGVLVGMVVMFPYIYRWMKFPVIYALPIPEVEYRNLPEITYTIKDVITKRVSRPTDMDIIITDEYKIREYCLDYYDNNDACSTVMGFYRFDRKENKHLVFSIDNARILQHEIRHAFEGSYHRSLGDH